MKLAYSLASLSFLLGFTASVWADHEALFMPYIDGSAPQTGLYEQVEAGMRRRPIKPRQQCRYLQAPKDFSPLLSLKEVEKQSVSLRPIEQADANGENAEISGVTLKLDDEAGHAECKTGFKYNGPHKAVKVFFQASGEKARIAIENGQHGLSAMASVNIAQLTKIKRFGAEVWAGIGTDGSHFELKWAHGIWTLTVDADLDQNFKPEGASLNIGIYR